MIDIRTWEDATARQKLSLKRYAYLLEKFKVRNELPKEEANELTELISHIGYLSSCDVAHEKGEEIL